MAEPKKIKLTPDIALTHVDGACKDYKGTRGDHQILEGSMIVLRDVVEQWKAFKAGEAKTADVKTAGVTADAVSSNKKAPVTPNRKQRRAANKKNGVKSDKPTLSA
jgi:hypothetical protein